MNFSRLIFRNLIHYWRTNLPIVAGIAVAVAVLSGALLVGHSVRSSLRRLLYERIGATEYVISGDRFFTEDLAAAFPPKMRSCPIIQLKGVLVQEQNSLRAYNVNVYGIDEKFWQFQGRADQPSPEISGILVGAPLARQLSIRPGDSLLLTVESQQAIPSEWLYGKRDDTGKTLRLRCSEILPENRLGEFALRPSQGNVYSIFVSLKRLQKELAKPSQENAILLAGSNSAEVTPIILDILRKSFTLQDIGLRLRDLPSGKGFSLESNQIILPDSAARAAVEAAVETGSQASPIYSYLANSIRSNCRGIPYSVITAADLGRAALGSIKEFKSTPALETSADHSHPIWLTDWAQQDLGISAGAPVDVDYFVWTEEAKLETHTARFHLAGIIPTSGDVDPALAPDIPGITEAHSISSWDPPFPLNLSLIRRQDEEYWNQHRATPKAFITLAEGQDLWRNRFGTTTGVRILLPAGTDLASGKQKFSAALVNKLNPEQAGLAIRSIRELGLAASQGSTDFGEYFLYFSSFLIAAAILLSALFFKLMIEQRVGEVGILRALGFPSTLSRRVFVVEGLILSLAGSLVGLAGSVAYGWIMVYGLRRWWIGAVGTDQLFVAIAWTDLAVGAAAGILISMGMIAWTLRILTRSSPRMLFSGVLESPAVQTRRTRTLGIISFLGSSIALVLVFLAYSGRVSQMESFFAAGSLLMISLLSFTGLYLRRRSLKPLTAGGAALLRFGIRNATHRPARSFFCAALIASATFVIIAMEGFREDPQQTWTQQNSGTGGYPLLAETALPVIQDLNSSAGRESLGIDTREIADFAAARFISFRERAGDDASCLNLYSPQEPRILGAPRSFIEAGRFSFQDSMASTPEEKRNPWLLLEAAPNDGTVPAVADASTIQYILHRSLGSILTIHGSRGNPVRLRLVAALRDSIFQGELLISESNFLAVFPEIEGHRFFLLDLPFSKAASFAQPLRLSMAHLGTDVEFTSERLAAYHRVENTYLSTFQSLGALGLVLGTLGLASVLLRNVLERRHELALLRAVGFRRNVLSGLILAENVALMAWGLLCGTVCALVAVIPALHARASSFPLLGSGLILVSVFFAGGTASIIAVIAAYRAPLLHALRSE
jgi:ABC-type lipoprotein release transport system permease subunit